MVEEPFVLTHTHTHTHTRPSATSESQDLSLFDQGQIKGTLLIDGCPRSPPTDGVGWGTLVHSDPLCIKFTAKETR